MLATRSKRWRPRWTLRLRLTVLYGSVFLLAGAILLGITYALVANSSSTRVARDNQLVVSRPVRIGNVKIPPLPPAGAAAVVFNGAPNAAQLQDFAGRLTQTFSRASTKRVQEVAAKAKAVLVKQRSDELDSLLTESAIALGIMAFVSMGLGWLMAGRALRPLRTMGARARGISERNLHERLALGGPDDELKELGDTFDNLLGRLEKAFDSQRRFVANASHELRTPITLERALVEVALADPDASSESLRDTCGRVLTAVDQQERLIEALLTLASSQRGLAAQQKVDLPALAGPVISSVESNGVRLETELQAASTTGDPRLLERLIANLVENGVKYNRDRGWVKVGTGIHDGCPTLQVVNTGPVIESGSIGELVQPFRRLNGGNGAAAKGGSPPGLGLGLSIVAAIAEAHGATLGVQARAEGGLDVQVEFPLRPAPALD